MKSGSLYYDPKCERYCVDNAEQKQLSSGLGVEVLAIDGVALEWTAARVEYDHQAKGYCFMTSEKKYPIEEGMMIRY